MDRRSGGHLGGMYRAKVCIVEEHPHASKREIGGDAHSAPGGSGNAARGGDLDTTTPQTGSHRDRRPR